MNVFWKFWELVYALYKQIFYAHHNKFILFFAFYSSWGTSFNLNCSSTFMFIRSKTMLVYDSNIDHFISDDVAAQWSGPHLHHCWEYCRD